jgi:hypothetical protein
MSDGNNDWGSYAGTYTIPNGQTSLVIAFSPISSTGGIDFGNFIDDIQITINQSCKDSDGDGVTDNLDLDSDNDGISDIEEAGFKQYSSNTSTMDLTSVATWTDSNTNGINDAIDSMISASAYNLFDTDGDGIPNYLDLDTDGDGKSDAIEKGPTATPMDSDRDGIPDYRDVDIVNNPDINVTNINIPVSGNLKTNDFVLTGATYGQPGANTNNPLGATIVVNASGTYSFTGTVPGITKKQWFN